MPIKVEPDTKLIDCPEHPGLVHAVLYRKPSQYAGVWECRISKVGDVHEHENIITEDTVEDRMGFEGHFQVEGKIYVCADCGQQVEVEDAL